MIHYPVFMVMFESASVAQTNAGEHNHGSFVKNPWRRSNHRNPEEWVSSLSFFSPSFLFFLLPFNICFDF